MKIRITRLLLTVIATGCLFAAITGCRPQRKKVAPVNQVSAKFLNEHDLYGKVALIEFGLLGCELSEEGLVRMYRMHQDKAIPGLAYVRVEASDDDEALEKYYSEKALPFPVYQDTDAAVAHSFEATVYPCFVLVDKFGRTRYRGTFPVDKLSGWVVTLAKEKKDPGPDVALFGSVKLDIAALLSATKLPSACGKEHKSLADYAGKKGLMIVFVDTSCPFAGQTIRDMPKIVKTLSKHKVPVVLINIDEEEEPVKEFYKKTKTDTPVVFDTTSETHLKWNVHSVATVVLINKDRKLVYKGGAVWEKVAMAGEKGMGLKKGSLVFSVKGTEYG